LHKFIPVPAAPLLDSILLQHPFPREIQKIPQENLKNWGTSPFKRSLILNRQRDIPEITEKGVGKESVKRQRSLLHTVICLKPKHTNNLLSPDGN
jgi:hypothetical protein